MHWVLAALCVGGAIASCGLSTSGIPGGAETCGSDADCFGEDLCKIGKCGDDSACAFTPRPDGEPPVQIPGDCKQVTCKGGEMLAAADPTDNDDGNPCTKDDCNGGDPSHEVLDDVQCGATGVCKMGDCVISCTAPGDPCEEDPANPCTEDSCDVGAGVCIHTPLHGKQLDTGDPLDCKRRVCVQDTAQTVPYDEEVPDDKNPCTKDSCQSGLVHNDGDPSLAGQTCGASGVCNDKGVCVGCNSAADCPGIVDACQHPTCDGEVCGTGFEVAGTVVGDAAGNCLQVLCDGAGQMQTVTDGADTPPDDGNTCTDQVCSGNNPVYQPVASGTLCAGGVCNLTGQCVACNVPGDCGDAGTCKLATCSGNVCGVANVAGGTDDAGQCNDDGAASCDNDGVCDGNGQCRKYALGTSCSGAVCAGGIGIGAGACDGAGSCIPGPSQPCAPYACGAMACKTSCNGNSDCASPNVCNTTSHVCGLPNGTGCGSDGVCASGVCSDAVCCNMACPGACQECNLSNAVGMCTKVPTCGTGGCPAGSACDGVGTAGTSCKKLDGQSCSMGSECLGGSCSSTCSGDTC